MAVMRASGAWGKLAYGTVFVVVIPILLVWWAVATTAVVPLPTVPYPWAGNVLVGAGLLLVVVGMGSLWAYGRGLPMSPYPPPVYVARGIYRLTAHPIYLGFVLLCFGVSMVAESPSGMWLVSPAVALACVALVLGFERHEIRRRFGAGVVQKPLIALPERSAEAPTVWHRWSVFVLVLVPWSVAFEAVYRLGIPRDAIEAYLPFERGWPVIEATELVYGSVYLLVPAALFVVRTRAALRHLAVTGLIATGVVTLIYLTVPIVAPPRPFEPQSLLGRALLFERAMSHTVAAFPAFHVIWSFIAAEAWGSRSSRSGAVAWIWAILIAASCVTTGMHALVDVVSATVAFLVLRRYSAIWHMLREFAERAANSWHEWRVGGLRLINHGAYAALSGFVGLSIAAAVAGPAAFWQLVLVHFAGLMGAGLWAQTLEGSSKLSRPFGYYGSVLGVLAGAIGVGAVGGDTMLLLAAVALAAPWMQAIGRVRCLVQGCCHGREAMKAVGIRYIRARSRVCELAGLRDVPLHPTPLYSMLANLVIGVFLFRLWSLGAALSVVAGAYLMLAGVTRFVEESYRGEPQTPVLWGLRIYQWFAILSFVLGATLTTLPSGVAPGLALWFASKVIYGATLFGMTAGMVMGVDVPRSARRFARLARP